jgi:hypothetical protein
MQIISALNISLNKFTDTPWDSIADGNDIFS